MDKKKNLNFDFIKPEDNMQVENELLQLKLLAETGSEAHFKGKIPPEVQNAFLKNIIAFEDNFSKSSMISIFKNLKEPVFPAESELNDHAIQIALNSLIKLLNQKQINIEFLGEYKPRLKYKFITEELFEEEIPDNITEGMTCHFIYEEFHPNHTLDIGKKTQCFISDWIAQSINEHHPLLADTFTTPRGKILRKDEMVLKINNMFKCYSEFKNCHYTVDQINFELSNDTGLAFAEGHIKFIAVLYDKEEIVMEGPFKLYFNLEYDWWSIFYFVFPGFD
jgi:hypothetical protein